MEKRYSGAGTDGHPTRYPAGGISPSDAPSVEMKDRQLDDKNTATGDQAPGIIAHLVHVFQAFVWSLAGLGAALKHETAFRLEAILFAILAPLGIWLGQDGTERALLIGSLLLVLAVELVNSAVEAAIDRISDERHPLSKRAKDLGSAAVFLCLINVPVVWGLILADRFLK